MVTVLLCVLSSLAFCLCGRFFILVVSEPLTPAPVLALMRSQKVSGRARRFARNYVAFALVVMMIVSAVGAVSSYIELFRTAEFGF